MPIAPGELEEFEAQRPRLFAIAYRMLGSASEAEDAVQDTYLRWDAAERRGIREPAAWLTRVLTNLCVTRLTSARARRESYVGPWLPEPVLTPDPALGPLDTAEQRESISMAFLLLLERLTPPERAVFVLREAFGYGHREIAEILDLTETGSQQLYHRARQRVADSRADSRPRFEASPTERTRIARRFLAAARDGDLTGLQELLAADVVSWADGGGRTAAAKIPVRGAERVARYLRWMSRDLPDLRIVETEVNGQPGILALIEGEVRLAVVLDIADGRVHAIRFVNNPDKLAFLSRRLEVTGITAGTVRNGGPAQLM